MVEKPSFIPTHMIQPQKEAFSPIVYEGGTRPPLERKITDESIKTANHELNHALVGLAYGFLPVSISVEPDSRSLGRTVFAGDIPDEVFTVIAAGGAVETAFGEAKGYGNQYTQGSDFGYISQINRDATDIDQIYQSAVSDARVAISKMIPNKEVLRRASAIIADMKHVPGELLGKIIEIAEQEVNLGIENVGIFISEKIQTMSTQNKSVYVQTIIETDINGDLTKRVIILDPSEKDNVNCMFCGQFGGHEISCQGLRNTQGKSDLVSEDTVFEDISFSTNEVVPVG